MKEHFSVLTSGWTNKRGYFRCLGYARRSTSVSGSIMFICLHSTCKLLQVMLLSTNISVFFLSDLPSVISAEKLSFIDPHERFFVEDGKKVTGYTWHLKDDYKVYKSIQLQIVIIAQNMVYVCDMGADMWCYRLTRSKI